MSYKPLKNEDSLSELFSTINDCITICKKFSTLPSKEDFIRWMDKANTIDKRTTILYLRKHKEEIPEEYIRFADLYYKKYGGI